MRCTRKIGVLSVAFAMIAAATARAEPFVVASTTLTTSAKFDCRPSIHCTGEGTNSVTFLTSTGTATLTFTGLTQTFDVTNRAQRITLGSFNLTHTDGFTFPPHKNSPAQ